MESREREIRRLYGLFKTRLPELRFDCIHDPRGDYNREWSISTILSTVVVGSAVNCTGLGQLENLTKVLTPPFCNLLRLSRRLPDTTMRDVLVRINPDHVRDTIHRQIMTSYRRKSFINSDFSCGIVSIDGKYTRSPKYDASYSQRQSGKNGSPDYGLVRTLTCSLISHRSVPCIDAVPIPPKTNEMGHFKEAVRELELAYGTLNLYEIVMGDAGMCSLENANFIHNDCNKGYIFRLKDSQPTLLLEARRLLELLPHAAAVAESTKKLPGKRIVIRRLWLTTDMQAWMDWTHLRTVFRLQCTVIGPGNKRTEENRFYVTNVARGRFKPEKWLEAFQKHWRIENNTHWTMDALFKEDKHPWIQEPQGMLVVMLLRRISYNILALYRSVSQRSKKKRGTPWRTLFWAIEAALLQCNYRIINGIRFRRSHILSLANFGES